MPDHVEAILAKRPSEYEAQRFVVITWRRYADELEALVRRLADALREIASTTNPTHIFAGDPLTDALIGVVRIARAALASPEVAPAVSPTGADLIADRLAAASPEPTEEATRANN